MKETEPKTYVCSSQTAKIIVLIIITHKVFIIDNNK